MHETMVAQSLMLTISAEAVKQKARPVSAKISCGLLNAINDEVLYFAFEAVSKGTACEDMKLEIEHKPMQGRCKNCGRNFEIDPCYPKCSNCNSEDFELLADSPLVLETIEFETD